MNSPANATGEQPLMVATFQVLRRYRTWILATSAVVVAAAIAASLLMTRIYEAEVLVAHSSAQSSDETLGMLASRLGALMPMAGLGFGDVSNFNRAFRTEFSLSPRAYRQRFHPRLR